MFYAIVAGEEGTQGRAYRFLKFKTENAARECAKVDEFSLVYQTSEELGSICKPEDLESILKSMGVPVEKSYAPETLAKALFRLAEQSATWASQDQPDEPAPEPQEEEMAKTAKKAAKKKAAKTAKPKAAKVAKAPKEKKATLQAKFKGKLEKDAKIKKIAANPARPGSKRFENLETVLASRSVEEALRNLKALAKPGGMEDIRFAIANKLIEVQGG